MLSKFCSTCNLRRREASILALAFLFVLPSQSPLAPSLHIASAQAADEPATPAEAAAPSKNVLQIPVLYLKQVRAKNPPLSLLDIAPPDDGVAGAKLGIADNNTTGKFVNQSFTLDVVQNASADELISTATAKIASGTSFILADMEAADLLKLADVLAGKDAIILNIGSADDSLREENCRANVLHTPPTRSMLADALGQYFAWKKWTNWFLISGPQPEDKLFADAIKRSARWA